MCYLVNLGHHIIFFNPNDNIWENVSSSLDKTRHFRMQSSVLIGGILYGLGEITADSKGYIQRIDLNESSPTNYIIGSYPFTGPYCSFCAVNDIIYIFGIEYPEKVYYDNNVSFALKINK